MSRFQSSRRDFLKKSIVLTAACSASPYFAWSPKTFAQESAGNRLRIGCIGTGDMFLGSDGPQIAQFGDILAVCDVDANHLDQAKNRGDIGKGKADAYKDYRKILERSDIDLVTVVTVDHWHVKIAIEALQAGKHVFCQKPLTLTLEENQLIRNACKKYPNLAFIVGTQQRSDIRYFPRAVNMVRKGLLGDIQKITVGIDGSKTGGPFAKSEPPKELDWDLWHGQVPLVDYIKERCHYEFRWWYEYSGGKFTDWGAHHIDIATWALDQDKEGMGPIEIDGTDAKHPVPFKDGYPTIDDCYNTSNDFSVKCKFANGIEMDVNSRSDNGVLFEGTKGRIFVNRAKIVGKPIDEKWDQGQYELSDLAALYKGKAPNVDPNAFYANVCECKNDIGDGLTDMPRHKANLIRCIREGGLTVSDVFSHVQTMNTCHLCGIASRLGRVIRWDPQAEKIVGDEQAAAFFTRTPRKGFEIPRV